MALNTICPPCEMGDHKNHYRTVRAVSEGMMGGAVCTCKGECKDGRYQRVDPAMEAIKKFFAEQGTKSA